MHRIMAITSAFQADDAGSIPAARSNSNLCADIAQSVERTLGKGEVPSSNLGTSTIYFVDLILQINHRICLTTIALWTHLIPCRTQK